MIKAVLFDLDGTLAPMEQDIFVETYLSALAKKLAPYGYEPQKLVKSIWMGTREMIKNDGTITNEKAFWNYFCSEYGEGCLEHIPVFDEFYEKDFPVLGKLFCTPNPDASKAVDYIKLKGLRVSLATNPLFPATATQSRIRWAAFEPSDFENYTSYETSHYCKPNIEYYKEVLRDLNLDAKDCLMVGNDALEDTVVTELGMKVFLITDFLINKDGRDISCYPNGSFIDLINYIETME